MCVCVCVFGLRIMCDLLLRGWKGNLLVWINPLFQVIERVIFASCGACHVCFPRWQPPVLSVRLIGVWVQTPVEGKKYIYSFLIYLFKKLKGKKQTKKLWLQNGNRNFGTQKRPLRKLGGILLIHTGGGESRLASYCCFDAEIMTEGGQ